MSADQERPICPVTKLECSRDTPCAYRPDTYYGKTYCAEWALKQQTEGKREKDEKAARKNS